MAPRRSPRRDPIERLRAVCMSFPDMTERLSHGSPSWFAGSGKMVVSLDDHHHGKDHLAFCCPAPIGVQAELVEQEPERFFRPPYVGIHGWLGVRIDRDPDWDEITVIIEDAYRKVASRKLVALLDQR